MNEGGQKPGDLLQRLEQSLDSFTPAERTIAHFILTNTSGIAFETARSVAAKLKVSATTVGRFSRMLGYRHFKDLKDGLRTSMTGAPWLVGEQMTEFVGKRSDADRSQHSLELELAGIIEVYAMARTDAWKQIASLLARSPHVHVAGFQTERGVAGSLAHFLQYTRENVSLVDGTAGNYHEIFAAEPEGRCLVIVDMRRYSEQAYELAERANREGIALVMITDKFCDWISKFTNHVHAVPTEVELFWSSQVALSCAVNLLVNDVIGILGTNVEKRLERLSELYQSHTGHVGTVVRRRPGNMR